MRVIPGWRTERTRARVTTLQRSASNAWLGHRRTAWLLLALALPLLARADTLVTLLIDEAYPPYSYRTAEGVAGICADILRATEPLLPGYRLKLDPQPWRRALVEIEAGSALAIVAPCYRPQERPWMTKQARPRPIQARPSALHCATTV